MSGDRSDANTSYEKSVQIKVTNERLAKLEQMYEELSLLEAKTKKKK